MKTTGTLCAVIALVVGLSLAAPAGAASSASWISPPDGSSFVVGTEVDLVGQASASGTTGGTGLDLAFVLDSSGSMSRISGGKSLREWQADAAKALVDVLPMDTTSVSVIEFDSDASTVKVLTPLTGNIGDIKAAIDSVDAYGTTYIGRGINEAKDELTGPNHILGRSQMMVVMSDGETSYSDDPGAAADAAILAGVDQIHSVGMPGHSVSTMTDIADGVSAADPADDIGTYTAVDDLSDLEDIFTGTGGSLVGLDHIDIEMPDGTMVPYYSVDGLGNFQIDDYTMELGANVFTVYAYGTDGSSASATLTLNGTPVIGAVPEPLTMLAVFGATATLGGYIRRRR